MEFRISNPTDRAAIWAAEMAANTFNTDELGLPTGVTAIDGTRTLTPVRPDDVLCVCSRLASIPSGSTATYFVYLESSTSPEISISIPTFPLVSGVALEEE